MQKYKCSLKPTASLVTSWSARTAQSHGTGLVGSWQSSRVDRLYTKKVVPTGRSIHTPNTVASLPTWHIYYTWRLSHRLHEPTVKGGTWDGLPWLAHSHAQSSIAKISVDLLSWPYRSQWKRTGRETGKHSRHHIWSAPWQGRGA